MAMMTKLNQVFTSPKGWQDYVAIVALILVVVTMGYVLQTLTGPGGWVFPFLALGTLEFNREKAAASRPKPFISTGVMRWKPPSRMRVARKETVEVRIGNTRAAVAALRDGLEGQGAAVDRDIRIAPSMTVRLFADPAEFTITPVGSSNQMFLDRKHVLRWTFDVTPLRSGERTLHLIVTMRLNVGGRDEFVDVHSHSETVKVAVDPWHSTKQFLRQHWKWVIATLAALVTFVLASSGLRDSIAKWIYDLFH